ncbi:MAG: hypothetical protein ABFR62_14170 [Bacteroidota bacterium]
MKKGILFILMLVLSVNLFAGKNYYKAELLLKSGDVKQGYANWVAGNNDEFVYYKGAKKEKAQKIEAVKIDKIIFDFDGDKVELKQLKVYKGWSQKKIKGPIWLETVQEGIVTLFVVTSELQGGKDFGGFRGSATFHDYYCIREGEPAAKWISAVSTGNNNQMFRAKAPLYFADYPELAKKIKDKEYRWKDLTTVIDLYNNWASDKL